MDSPDPHDTESMKTADLIDASRKIRTVLRAQHASAEMIPEAQGRRQYSLIGRGTTAGFGALLS